MDLDHLTELYESSPDAGVGTAAGLQRSPGDAQAGTNNNTHDPESAFGRLVLQEGHKDMIISLISQHFRHKESSTNHKGQFDIVKGKGRHLLMHPDIYCRRRSANVASLYRQGPDYSFARSPGRGENINGWLVSELLIAK